MKVEYSCLTELSEQDWEIQLHPNPNDGMLYINSTFPVKFYAISNTRGQLIVLDAYGSRINTEILSSGIYFISVVSVPGEVVKMKFIK